MRRRCLFHVLVFLALVNVVAGKKMLSELGPGLSIEALLMNGVSYTSIKIVPQDKFTKGVFIVVAGARPRTAYV